MRWGSNSPGTPPSLTVSYYQSSMLIIYHLRQISLATDSIIDKTR